MVARTDPYRQLRFVLEIEGLVTAGFSRCDLPSATSAVVEYREGADQPTPRKLPGLNEYGPLVLEVGVTDRSLELSEWRTLVEQGKMTEARRDAAVVLLDATGNPAARWVFREAWPSRYDAPRLDAMTSEVAVERLVVVHEGFARVAVETGDDEDDTESDGGSTPSLPDLDFPVGEGLPQGIDEPRLKTSRAGDEEPDET
ncbi:phage tail protein [Haloferax sp. Atlit-10N]|uniref:Phage tail tube protein gp19 n=1 Tax=Haloferax prahovense (strain DSM 18310 / JCM 13924 / TL6) TaxID=1227461 RepID=M0FU25_HALPT|nr:MULTISPECIES: phage tail protein [Haloferax]ELZ63465.1 phage tail tube protein gp19 [Haloferax prahovense DSM 18310]RDZ39894.1 phage tail protein [Haloferax sp. Atlit-16N]RDZ51179.1 phage tail protein [Haloferax sp. Atlit-4N]RDZ56580.1 phage tail protein [Haloferax sp. Atlit-10N]REA02780.1 phage tail protein [Haloferax sp. Atlit-6N]